jgi:hypothetical protein
MTLSKFRERAAQSRVSTHSTCIGSGPKLERSLEHLQEVVPSVGEGVVVGATHASGGGEDVKRGARHTQEEEFEMDAFG